MDARKTLKNNRKINPLRRCYVKQKSSETQHFCGYRDAEGMKLGFTAFLIPYDDRLDLGGIWGTHQFSEFRSTQPTGLKLKSLEKSNCLTWR